jgi:hypothetical protein
LPRRAAALVTWTGVLLDLAGASPAQQVLYGGNDKATGVATLFADNNDGYQESSIAFAPNGGIYQTVSTCCATYGGNPKFQTLDPLTGGVLTSIPVTKYFKALAVREDGAVFGAAMQDILANDVSELYRIEPSTAAADLLGETGHNPIGALVFGPVRSCADDDSCFAPRPHVAGPGASRPGPREVVRPEP